MPVIATNYSVGTVAVLICAANSNPQNLHVHNNSEHTVYLGNANVTTTTGLNLPKQTTEEFYVVPGDSLYAISDGAARDVRILSWIK